MWCSLIYFRDAVSNCETCISSPGCKFCLSSLQCESASSSEYKCQEEIISKYDCPSLLFDIGLANGSNSSQESISPSTPCTEGNVTGMVDSWIGESCQSVETISPSKVLKAANSASRNGKGSNLILKSGNGTSFIGGWGGDIQFFAGNGNGSE